ncbi:MAG: hypothetical protein GY842_07320, partial [bacterium]|nr:hypothetical protein [bacterium]
MDFNDAIWNMNRRRFLAWVGAAAGSLLIPACHSGSDSVPGQGGTETRTLGFNLFGLEGLVSDLRLWVRGVTYPLETLNAANHTILENQNPMAAKADPAKLTHFVNNVMLPADMPTGLLILGKNASGHKTLVGNFVRSTSAGLESVTRQASKVIPMDELFQDDLRLERLGIFEPPSNVDEVLSLNDLYDTATSDAQWLVFQHPTIMNLDSEGSAITNSLITQSNELAGVISALDTLLTNVGTYGQYQPMTDGAGNQLYVNPGNETQNNGIPAQIFQPFMDAGTMYEGIAIPDAWTSALTESLSDAVTAISNKVQDTEALEDSSWVLTPGDPPQDTDQASNPPDLSASASFAMDSSGFHSQTKVEVLSFTQGSQGPKVKIRAYNNNEKFQGIYVQFYNADDNQIKPVSGGKVSDEDPTSMLGHLSTVQTVLGIPIFDTNYADYTVVFPSDATYAKILVCSLGTGSKWTSLFGSQYQGKAYPAECQPWIIWTSVVNLGFPTLALLLDVGILVTVYKSAASSVEQYVDDEASMAGNAGDYPNTLGTQVTTALAAFKNTFVFFTNLLSGTLTMESVINGGAGSVLKMVMSMGQLFWQLLRATPLFSNVLANFYASCTVQEAEDAIPLVGTILAAISVLSDVDKLSFTVAEWVTEDWVIVRKLSGTYTATVTIQKDDNDATFPKSATLWKLTPQLSGGGSQPSVSNSQFQQGGFQSDDLIIKVPNIPVGGQIRYVANFTDPNGWTVGTVTSGWFDNFDVDNLPSPTMKIKEFAPPLSSGSSFTRRFTTQFDTAADDYNYSAASDIPGTVQTQQVCTSPTDICGAGSIAVGTVTGLVGYVYNTENGWFVRQISCAQTPGSGVVSIDTAYAAEPLLIYDTIGHSASDGANYLLEPLGGGQPGYSVRKLDLTASGFGINTDESWGQFNDTLDAVVQHPAGFIVG